MSSVLRVSRARISRARVSAGPVRASGPPDRGSGTLAAGALVAVAAAVLVLLTVAGNAFAARQRAQTAADLGALAGADVVVGRRAGDACETTRRVVAAHRGRVIGCEVRDGGVDVLVRVRLDLPGPASWASARARAGPAP